MSRTTWELLDHVCNACGGRMLRGVTGFGPTGGGNRPVRCADCGGRDCWCNFTHRAQNFPAYICQPFSVLKEKPQLLEAFRSCGCEPGRQEVGIMLAGDYRRLSEPET